MRIFFRLMIISIIVGIGFTLCITYVGAKPKRRPDAPKPQPVMETVDFSKLYFEGDGDVISSPDKKPIFSVIVVIQEPTKMTDTDKYGRMVRKRLISKGVRVITGEVQVLSEQILGGQQQETLTEAEKLVLVGEKTGADAFLVFDSIGMKELQYDIFIRTPENGGSKIILKDIGTGSVPKGAIRRSIPAIVVQGRMVDSQTAAIVAEFDIVHNIFKNEKELRNLKKQIPKYEYTPVSKTEYYVESRGCEKKNVRYQYIDHYQRKDIRREMIVTTIDQYIPEIEEIDRVKAEQELDKFLTQVLDKII